jgi:hypothetical protein
VKALWKKLKQGGVELWAALGGLALLALGLLGHTFAQERLKARRRAADARTAKVLEDEAQRAQERARKIAAVQAREAEVRRMAAGRKAFEAEARDLEREIGSLSDEELEARWRAFVAEREDD